MSYGNKYISLDAMDQNERDVILPTNAIKILQRTYKFLNRNGKSRTLRMRNRQLKFGHIRKMGLKNLTFLEYIEGNNQRQPTTDLTSFCNLTTEQRGKISKGTNVSKVKYLCHTLMNTVQS